MLDASENLLHLARSRLTEIVGIRKIRSGQRWTMAKPVPPYGRSQAGADGCARRSLFVACRTPPATVGAMRRALVGLAIVFLLGLPAASAATTVHVAPNGRDTADGSATRPFATLSRAQSAVRALMQTAPGALTVELAPGTYHLAAPLVLSTEDSGRPDAPITYAAAPGAEVRLTGSVALQLTWQPWRDGILQANVPPGLVFDQLFVNGSRQVRARFPNFDAANPLRDGPGYMQIADGTNKRPDTWVSYDPATFSPRIWQNPTTGIVHGFQSHNWGNMQYRLAGVDLEQHRLRLGEGGWQLQRSQGLGRAREAASPVYVENILEELDAPGEWFLDAKTHTLYWLPPAGVAAATARLEAVVLKNLIVLRGTAAAPVRHLAFRGLTFTQTALTFMESYEPVSRGDWAIHRGGAILLEGAEDCRIEDCDFDTVGGNAIFLSNYNRRVAVRACRFFHTGESAVALVGSPAAVRNYQTWDDQDLHRRPWISDVSKIDPTPGPRTPDYPADCLIENCLMSEIGDFGKQVAGVFIAMSHRITVRHCTIFGTARAGICINDGTWGGHVIADCDIWDTIRETGEHGPFNSWGRDRMWLKEGGLQKQLVPLDALDPTLIRHNRIANYRPSISAGNWTIDLDDGSSRYEISDNLSLGSTLKLRDGFFRTVWNNIFVSAVPLGFHVWPAESGDRFFNNVTVVAGARPGVREAEAAMIRPIRMRSAGWAGGFDRNLYWNVNTRVFRVENDDWAAWRARGIDQKSVFADPQFVDPEAGDYRLRDTSPALALGFRNFTMDGFGHQMTRISPRAGEFVERVVVTLTPDVRGGEVRYTLDGSEVSAASARYAQPLVLTNTTTVNARTFRDGLPVGFAENARFLRVSKVVPPSWLKALINGAVDAKARNKETHEWLGATLQSVAGDGDLIDATGGQDFGLFLRDVPTDSDAARAGLQVSDVVSACNGQPLRRWADLELALRQTPGAPVRLTVRRNQSTITLNVPVSLP